MNAPESLRARVAAIGAAKVVRASGVPFSTMSRWMNSAGTHLSGPNQTKIENALAALEATGAVAPERAPHAYSREFLRALATRPDADLAVVEIAGDSMAETLRPGDLVLVDRGVKTIGRDGIYLLDLQGAVVPKRCQIDPVDGSVIIRSDNPNYRELRSPASASLAVVGLVLWAARAV